MFLPLDITKLFASKTLRTALIQLLVPAMPIADGQLTFDTDACDLQAGAFGLTSDKMTP